MIYILKFCCQSNTCVHKDQLKKYKLVKQRGLRIKPLKGDNHLAKLCIYNYLGITFTQRSRVSVSGYIIIVETPRFCLKEQLPITRCFSQSLSLLIEDRDPSRHYFKFWKWGWSNVSVVKSTSCSSEGPRFSSWYPHSELQSSTHMVHMHALKQNIHI